MSLNSFGHLFRVTTWGESHGPALGATVDGCPPGISINKNQVLLDSDKIMKNYIDWFNSFPFDVGNTTKNTLASISDKFAKSGKESKNFAFSKEAR